MSPAPSPNDLVRAALALPEAERLEVARRIYQSLIPAGMVVEGSRGPDAPSSDFVSSVVVSEDAVTRTSPDYGFFPWWPEDGDSWLCPADITTARSMIPSERVWRRELGTVRVGGEDYQLLTYGALKLRVRQPLWRSAPYEGLDVSDWVEVLPFGIKNEPQTGTIREVLIDEETLKISYQIKLGDGRALDKRFTADDLRKLTNQGLREAQRIEPPDDDGDDLELADD